MNLVVRRMWDRDITMGRWAEANGFNPRYVGAIVRGNRGSWNCGVGRKILKALRSQGLMTEAEYEARTAYEEKTA